ncbi:TetR/AcrR family transcriptional regulator [Paenibacillus aestuarii]|uniref:TetR/AcrR family transcriptional regulator n=1 Tax=Paenibacillus aestuarii TaxID=516965 RepID=A0ABW0K2M1_9BACL|nr:TetR/AcrR family transcriptional regulator [Paenibacillus aestuarii]
MKRNTEKSAEQLSDERREQIKRAALKVFAIRGIEGTKMSMIAAEAGISQGLSYRYFNSKEEIFSLLVQEAIDEAQSAIRTVSELPGTPKEQLLAFTQRMLDDNHKYHFLLLQHGFTSEVVPLQAKLSLEQYKPEETIEHFVPLFTKGQERGEFRTGDPQKLLFLYFSVVTGLMLQHYDLPPNYWQQQVSDLMRIIMK